MKERKYTDFFVGTSKKDIVIYLYDSRGGSWSPELVLDPYKTLELIRDLMIPLQREFSPRKGKY